MRELFDRYLSILISVFVLILSLGAQEIDSVNEISSLDSLKDIQDSIDKAKEVAKKISQDTTKNNLFLPDSSILNTIKIGADSVKESYEFKVDSQFVMFMDGVDKFKSGSYYDALEIFQELNSIEKSKNRFMAASDMMIVKTYFKLGKIDKTLSKGYEFETYYSSDSDYLDDVRYTIARASFKKENHVDALLYYLQILKNYSDPRLCDKVRQQIGTLVDLFFSIEELKKLENSVSDKFITPFIYLKLAEKYHEKGKPSKSRLNLNSAYPYTQENNILKVEYDKTNEFLQASHQQRTYIGIILPLSGTGSDIGKEILKGVRYAIDRLRETENLNIAGIVMDNQGSLVRTIKQTQQLTKNPKLSAIFGPVSSKNAIGVGAVANQAEIPFLTPTATSSKISDLGSWSFLANVDQQNLGRFIGKYAVQLTDIKNIVSLSPGGDLGKEMTDAFSKTVDKGGVKILSQKWYTGTPEDLGYHFEDIRKIGIDLANKNLNEKIKRMTDSLNYLIDKDSSRFNTSTFQLTRVDTSKTDSARYNLIYKNRMYSLNKREVLTATGLMDSLEFEIPKEDSLEYEINTIDGMFIPGSGENIEMLVSQIDYYHLNTRIFGNASLWNNIDILKSNKYILDSLVFVSDYYIDENSSEYKKFAQNYDETMGDSPQRFELYGYDSVMPILNGIKNGNDSRKELRRYLIEMPIYDGISRNISFKGKRPGVNSCAYILQFRNGQIEVDATVKQGNVKKFEKE